MVTGQALSHGPRAAGLCILGELAGGVVLVALSLFGVGAILAASAALFQVIKWAGVCYMAYLGWCQIADARKLREDIAPNGQASAGMSSLRAGFVTAVLNPKAIIFYVAFLSQFLNPQGNTLLQFGIVLITSTVIVGAVLGAYALLASQARRVFVSARTRRRLGYTGGGFLIGGSAFMAASR